jgi:hypothetical protein
MIERLFPPLVFAGPFRRSGIGGCRTFCGATIGVCRTFFLEWLRLRGFPKPKKGLRFRAYKAFVYSKHLYSKRGERAAARLLEFLWMRRAGGLQEQSARDDNSKEKEGAIVRRWAGTGVAGPPDVRRAIASHGGRQQGSGSRSATVHSAWESRQIHAARDSASRTFGRDPRADDLSWHSFLVTYALASSRGSRPRTSAPTRCPHDSGPAA